MAGAHLRQAICLSAHGFGNVAILREMLKVFASDARHDAYGSSDGSPGIAHQIMYDCIRARPRAIHGDEPQRFFGDGSHGSYAFNFVLRDARVVDDSHGDDPVGIAYENRARFAVAFEAELDTILDRHEHDTTYKRDAFRRGIAFTQGLADDAVGIGFTLLVRFFEHLQVFERQPG